MTSELRPTVEVWRDASDAATLGSVKYKPAADEAAAAVIEADREAVRAPLLAEIERLTLTVRKLQGNQAALEAELAKFKALAETLAGALEAGTRFMPPSATVWHREAAKALREYKEARDER